MRLPRFTFKRIVIGLLLTMVLVLVISSIVFGAGSEVPGPPEEAFTTP